MLTHRRLAIASLALFLAPALSLADSPPKPLARLTFRSADGKSTPWKDLTGTKVTVAVFMSFDCPVSTSYATPLAEMATEFAGKGVKFIGLCPCDDDLATVAKQTKDYKVPFPVFKDERLAAADAFNATITPQVFVLDDHGVIRYRGLIDNTWTARLKRNAKVSEFYLKDAIEAVLAGKPVAVAKTDAVGCTVTRTTATAPTTEVSYYKDVEPILQKNCQSCHRPGEVGPFSLMTYKQAVTWAGDIKEYTHSRKMPPWKVQDGKPFVGDRRLSDKELEIIAKWADGGTPAGDPKDAPTARSFVEGWQLGKPDLVLSPSEEFVLGPTGKDHFRVYVMPTGLKEDQFVTAVEIRPGNPRVVHHTLNFFDTTGSARKLQAEADAKRKANPPAPDAVDVGPGYASGMGVGFKLDKSIMTTNKPPMGALGGWAPGIMPRFMPEGTGYYLPAGSDVIIQMHYHRNGKLEKDRTQIGLYFSKKPIDHRMLGLVVPGRFKTEPKAGGGRFGAMGYIPAGDSHFVAKGAITALEDCTMYTVMPHMHLLGKSVKITMTVPGGKPEVLIDIPDWDYNWQEQYQLKAPIKVKSGTRFEIEAVYDNSATNPNNPSSPPIDVRFGEQTTNEMLFGFLGAIKDTKGGNPNFILFLPEFRR
jgi:peroxiredoxin